MSERSEEDVAHAAAVELTAADAEFEKALRNVQPGASMQQTQAAVLYILERLGAPSDAL